MKMVLEYEYLKSSIANIGRPAIPIVPYVPAKREAPKNLLEAKSSWKGIESILADIIQRFDLGTKRCLEFGVEYGYSTAALSSFFDEVVGVDIFTGDMHTGTHRDIYKETADRLKDFKNIRLVKSDYREWIKTDKSYYDLIHVDIIHTYTHTLECGLWAANHSKCVIFHDTESFRAVRFAVAEIARRTGKTFYNYPDSYGLGIVV